MIKALIVDDSPIVRQILAHLLQSDSDIEVIGAVQNGIEAIDAIKIHKPDVITMDLQMPKMDGIAATKAIMSKSPIPIIILTSGNNAEEAAASFQALEAGAVAVILKPNSKEQAKKLLDTIKLMSQVKVVTQIHHKIKTFKKIATAPSLKQIELIAIGVSTGGPSVLQTILTKLNGSFPPIVIVQHISPGFIEYMANWLSSITHRTVQVAANGKKLEKNHIYLAPDFCHLGISKDFTIELNTKENLENSVQPSISYLFRSIAKHLARQSMAVILTGMGNDGTKELKILKDKGALTICQNKESSIVYGMPSVAKELNAASYILSPEEIANMINGIYDEKIN
jgi:two-component system chemotaxis response regulator CheB